MIRLQVPLGLGRRLPVLLLGTVMLSLFAAWPVAAIAKDGPGEVRIAGVCSNGATSELRLRSRDQGIELRFKLDHGGAGAIWRVVVVQERRIAWKGAVRTTRSDSSFEVRRTLQDLPGADTVTANAWGPRGLGCRAEATLPDS
jgi:hypothetical protein